MNKITKKVVQPGGIIGVFKASLTKYLFMEMYCYQMFKIPVMGFR